MNNKFIFFSFFLSLKKPYLQTNGSYCNNMIMVQKRKQKERLKEKKELLLMENPTGVITLIYLHNQINLHNSKHRQGNKSSQKKMN